MPDLIKLPSERVDQLRNLSANRSLPIADLIGEYVNDQITKGNLDPAIPSITVKRTKNAVWIDFGVFQRDFQIDVAKAYAASLKWLAAPRRAALGMEQIKDAAIAASGMGSVGLSRRGTSIKVSGDDGAERTLAPSIARDLAALIEQAAR